MNPVMLIGSLVAVLMLAFIARWLGLGGDARIDETQVRQLAALQGFDVVDVALDRAGLAALVRDAGYRFMLVRRHGAHFLIEPLASARDVRLDHRFLTVGRVTLDLGERAGIWAASLRRMSA